MSLIIICAGTKLFDLIPPPEHHLMLGSTKKIFDKLNKKWGKIKLMSGHTDTA